MLVDKAGLIQPDFSGESRISQGGRPKGGGARHPLVYHVAVQWKNTKKKLNQWGSDVFRGR